MEFRCLIICTGSMIKVIGTLKAQWVPEMMKVDSVAVWSPTKAREASYINFWNAVEVVDQSKIKPY